MPVSICPNCGEEIDHTEKLSSRDVHARHRFSCPEGDSKYETWDTYKKILKWD